MVPTLSLSGDFDHPNLDVLCEELQPLRDWAPGTPARLDLGKLGALAPSTLAVLLASLRDLRTRQVCDPLENFTPPEDQRTGSCLSWSGMEHLISYGTGHWEQAGAGSAPVLGCEPFASSLEVDRVTSSLSMNLNALTGWSDTSLSSFGSLAFEFAQNVMQHSDAHGGVVVLKVHPAKQAVTLAIADCGIGVRESLSRNPKYEDVADDLRAISAAVGPWATGEPGTGGGMGLFFARLVVQENGGNFMIRSGDACREENKTVADRQHLPHLRGTLITVEAKTDQAFDYDRIDAWSAHPRGISE